MRMIKKKDVRDYEDEDDDSLHLQSTRFYRHVLLEEE